MNMASKWLKWQVAAVAAASLVAVFHTIKASPEYTQAVADNANQQNQTSTAVTEQQTPDDGVAQEWNDDRAFEGRGHHHGGPHGERGSFQSGDSNQAQDGGTFDQPQMQQQDGGNFGFESNSGRS